MEIISRVCSDSVRLMNNRRLRLIAVLGLLGLLWGCYPVTDTTYSYPQDSGTATWLIEFRTGEEKIHMEMRYERHDAKGNHSSSHGFTIDPTRLNGLTREQAMSGGRPVR